MNERIYIVNWNAVVTWMLPLKLAIAPMFQWVRALIRPVERLHKQFLVYKKLKDYDLMITTQVCYVEAMLNDSYDKTLRRIFITDGDSVEPLWLYTDAELQPINLFTDGEGISETLFTEGEVNGILANDFIINIPISITLNIPELIGKVKRKKLLGMRFDIQFF